MSEAFQIEMDMALLLKEMHAEGHIDNQFEQLLILMLQDDSEPDFIQSVIEFFFQDSQDILQKIHQILTCPHPDFNALDEAVHQLKGSASSFGADSYRVTKLCVELRKTLQTKETATSVAVLERMAIREGVQRCRPVVCTSCLLHLRLGLSAAPSRPSLEVEILLAHEQHLHVAHPGSPVCSTSDGSPVQSKPANTVTSIRTLLAPHDSAYSKLT